MNKTLFASLVHAPLLAAAWLIACGQTASLEARACPCSEGWTCCSTNVCVAPGTSCEDLSPAPDAGRDLPDSRAPEAATSDARHDSADGASEAAAPPGAPRIFVQGQSVACVTSDATHLYWVGPEGALVQVTESTHGLEVLTATFGSDLDGGSCGLATAAGDFYYVTPAAFAVGTYSASTMSSIDSAPVLAQGASSVVTDGMGSVWVTQPQSGQISKCAITSAGESDVCMPGAVIAGLSQPDSLVADAENLYWIDRGDGSLMKSSKANPAATLVLAGPDSGTQLGFPQQLALGTTASGKTRLVWTTLEGAQAVNADGSGLVTLQSDPSLESGGGIATDGARVYWANEKGLNEASVSGGQVTLVAPASETEAQSVVYLSNSAVYWQDNDDNVWFAAK